VEARRIDDGVFREHLRAGQLQRAAAWLVEQHAHEVLALCRALVRDAAAAEDLAQEAFGRAFAGLPQFRGDASARTWLLAIARHGCIDHLRARRRHPWGGAGDADPADPDDVADDAPLPPDLLDSRAAVAAALDELAEGERALVVLRFAHGFEYSELAATFGLREGTVRMRLSRALARMRDRLAPPLAEAAAATPASFAAPLPGAPRPAPPVPPAPAAPVPRAAPAPARRRLAAAAMPFSVGFARALGGGGAPAPGPGPATFADLLQALDPGVPAAWRGRLLAAAQAI
jgi:RNA polymerase sigma-70 factor (ECF subfamily)